MASGLHGKENTIWNWPNFCMEKKTQSEIILSSARKRKHNLKLALVLHGKENTIWNYPKFCMEKKTQSEIGLSSAWKRKSNKYLCSGQVYSVLVQYNNTVRRYFLKCPYLVWRRSIKPYTNTEWMWDKAWRELFVWLKEEWKPRKK